MKVFQAGIAAALILATAGPAAARDIERYKNAGPTPSPILQGVFVPAGTDLMILSGQLAAPIDPAKPMSPTLTLADFGDTKTQTISAFTKIKTILESKGYKMSDIVKLTVFVAGDPAKGGKMDFAGMNEGYKMFFGTAENPNIVARSALQVAALAAPWALVEIEATAAKAPPAPTKKK
ncbi:MAG: endoribonuclease family protein [Sphingomonas bacterium]|nr:endoribonuclease family protein [Sphingomonas bacterium]